MKPRILCYSDDMVYKLTLFTTAIVNKMNFFTSKVVSTELKKNTLGFIPGKYTRMSHNMIILASQAKSINQHKNRERRVLICNANIQFSQKHIKKYLVPKYATKMLL